VQYDAVHYDVASRGLEPRHHDLHPCALPVELRSQALREQESNLRCRGPKPRRPCQQTIPECVRAGGFEPPTGSVSENCSHQTELHARALTNVDQVGVEPTTSPVQGERATRCATSPRPRPATGGTAYCERVTGIGPAWPVWKTGALPLSYTRGVLRDSDRDRTGDLPLDRRMLYH